MSDQKTEQKHTPGPWKVNYNKFSEVLAENGALVATCNRLGSLVNLQANANVIAQAPSLLKIAERLAAISEGLRNGNSSAEEEACRLADQAIAVVKEATGGPRHD